MATAVNRNGVSCLEGSVRFIATTFPMSLDSGTSVWALRRLGRDKYPGIANAKLIFWEGSNPPDNEPINEWRKRGYLAVNCGGGALDHHPHGEHHNQCTFKLVLRELGYQKDPRFARLARYTLWDDTRGFSRGGKEDVGILPNSQETDFVLARIFKDLQSGFKPTGDQARDLETMREVAQQALHWLKVALDCHLAKQHRFHREGGIAFRAARHFTITGQSGTERRFVIGRTDCDEFGGYARWSPVKPDLVIQGRHLGAAPEGVTDPQSSDWPINIQIFSTTRSNLDLTELVKRLRMEEMKFRRITNTVPLADLEKEGIVAIVPQWYFMPSRGNDGASMVLNGSPTHRNVEPTSIHFDRMKNLVCEWLGSL